MSCDIIVWEDVVQVGDKPRTGWDATILFEPQFRQVGEYSVAGCQVAIEDSQRVKLPNTALYDNRGTLEEAIGLVHGESKGDMAARLGEMFH